MVALLMREISTQRPISIERMLYTAGDVDAVWRLIVRIDQVARHSDAALQTSRSQQRESAVISREGAPADGAVCGIHALKGSRPTVLRQIVVKKTEAGTDDRVPAVPG